MTEDEKLSLELANEDKSLSQLGDDESSSKLVINSRYEIKKLIEQNNFVDSYIAHDLLLKRIVRLNILSKLSQNKESVVSRFKQETLNLSKIVHPNILRIYACAIVEDGRIFHTCDYIESISLENILADEKTFSIESFFSIFRQVIDALTYCHSLDIIHRNLNPSSILISKNEKDKKELVYITDFQFSKQLIENTDNNNSVISNSMKMLRKQAYLSPEQLNNKSADKRSDIYALGLMMKEFLLRKQNLASKGKSRQEKKCFEFLENLIQKCLFLEPEKRYSSLNELKTDFEKTSDKFTRLAETSFLASDKNIFKNPVFIIVFFILGSVLVSSLMNKKNVENEKIHKNPVSELKLQPAKSVDIPQRISTLYSLLKTYTVNCEPDAKETILKRWVDKYVQTGEYDYIERRDVFRELINELRKSKKLGEAEKYIQLYEPFTSTLPDIVFYVSTNAAILIDKNEFSKALSLIQKKRKDLIAEFGLDTFMDYAAEMYLMEAEAYLKQNQFENARKNLEPVFEYYMKNASADNKHFRQVIMNNVFQTRLHRALDMKSKVMHAYFRAGLMTKTLSNSELDEIVDYCLERAKNSEGLALTPQQIYKEFASDCIKSGRQDLAQKYIELYK